MEQLLKEKVSDIKLSIRQVHCILSIFKQCMCVSKCAQPNIIRNVFTVVLAKFGLRFPRSYYSANLTVLDIKSQRRIP